MAHKPGGFQPRGDLVRVGHGNLDFLSLYFIRVMFFAGRGPFTGDSHEAMLGKTKERTKERMKERTKERKKERTKERTKE